MANPPARAELPRSRTEGSPLATAPTSPLWTLATFSGRLAEVSGGESGAALTLAFRLVHEAQRRDEPAVWIGLSGSAFFPPDAAATGIDLEALPVIRAPGPLAAARSADHLIRSGAFGLVVIDLGGGASAGAGAGHPASAGHRAARTSLPLYAQARLVGLARRHGTALVCLTDKDDRRSSLGSLVSLRVHTTRARGEGGRFRCEARALKDKRRGPGWRHAEVCRGPDGLH